MAPAGPQAQVVQQFRALIWEYLDNGLLDSALFTAERLHAYDSKNPDTVHLYALCMYRNNQYRQAEALTKGWQRHVGCAYVFAQCCLKLGGGRETLAISSLEACKRSWISITGWSQHTDTERKVLPGASAVYSLLGKLHQSINDQKKAMECYVSAVKINPFLWEAFTGLCDTGVQLRVNNIYKQSSEMIEAIKNHGPSEEPVSRLRNTENQPDPFTAHTSHSRERDLSNPTSSSFLNRLNESSGATSAAAHHLETPTAQPAGSHGFDLLGGANGNGVAEKPPPISRKTRAATVELGTRRLGSRTTREISQESKRPISSSQEAPPAPARRSTRLNTLKFGSKGTDRLGTRDRDREKEREAKKRAVSTRSRTVQMSGTGLFTKEQRGTSEDTSMIDVPSRGTTLPPAPKIDTKREEAQLYLLDLYKKFANSYFCMTRYQCSDALQFLMTLPSAQREAPWVLCQIARAQYEMANYSEAEKTFLKVRQIDPVRTKDMEVFSTVLWHMRKDVDLSFLAHELMELDKTSPEAWCALGNCFSLQRDHDQALRCFKRATTYNPKLAYAFTLQGHEHVSNEEYDKAMMSYRSAMAADPRHYNAMYGIGKVYEKMGQYDAAEKHFKNAAKINPMNPVLVCCVGMVLEKVRDYHGALKCYNAAVTMAPRSALSRFKKARTLMSLQQYQAALNELKVLKDIAPDEANVHFLLGRLYKALHDKPNAIKHLTIALNLDPKASHLIKEVLENLDDEDDDGYQEETSEYYKLMDGDA
ncbi:TPR-like protein [Ascodesmis nigricans]|uniref:TPR-like protein n=1 Tax=Ascodesmis nigricans TaxID=341454 RepID=A0A4S2N7T0_9PEZI|nr:TPR-like protein [Ascodesmis nigricans]